MCKDNGLKMIEKIIFCEQSSMFPSIYIGQRLCITDMRR